MRIFNLNTKLKNKIFLVFSREDGAIKILILCRVANLYVNKHSVHNRIRKYRTEHFVKYTRPARFNLLLNKQYTYTPEILHY